MLPANRLKFVFLSVAVISGFAYMCKFYVAGNNRTATSESVASSPGPDSRPPKSDTCCKLGNVYTEDEPFDRFCVIITVFSRTDLTLQLLKHYSKLPRLTRIIIVWNNKNITPPLEEWDKLGPHSVPFHFKVQERNSLMNKLQLFPEIDTPGVLLVDDDQVISKEDIEFAFDTWKQVPHLIVGWSARQHGRLRDGTYMYRDRLLHKNEYSMVLTNGAFVHRKYMQLFPSEEVPESARKLVDKLTNCEDILFNVMVASYLKKSGKPQCPGLYTHPRDVKDIQRASNNQIRGLSLHRNHKDERDLCLNRFAEIYGEMPLMYSTITAIKYKRTFKMPYGVRHVDHI